MNWRYKVWPFFVSAVAWLLVTSGQELVAVGIAAAYWTTDKVWDAARRRAHMAQIDKWQEADNGNS